MPRSQLNDDELTQIIGAIVGDGGQCIVEKLLEKCPEYVSSSDPTGQWLQPCERFFRKEVAHLDFEVHFRHFLCDDDTVVAADIQFKRPSRFPAPFWNRNRRLVTRLRKLLQQRYSHPGVEVKDQNGGRQIHFNVCSPASNWHAFTSFEEWGSECAVYDEPNSSGQTDPTKTAIRNDFVIIRFRRRDASPARRYDLL